MTCRSWSSRLSNSGIAFKRALSIGPTPPVRVRARRYRPRRPAWWNASPIGAIGWPALPLLEFHARDEAPRARAGTLHLAHGTVRTPAFVPLATKAVLKTLEPHEVRALGFDMVLGNTFHLFLTPGHELIREFGGLHEFMRWEHAIITDSGGFQVFSMGYGTVADEIKGRAPQVGRDGERAGKILAIEEDGVTFRSYLDGSRRFMGPETSMEVQ